jgi:hypothetical protein
MPNLPIPRTVLLCATLDTAFFHHESSAPRRTLAGGATERCLVVREPVSRRQVTSDPSLHGSRELRAPSIGTHLGVDRRPSARSLGVMAQDGPDAGHAVVTLSASSASVRRPVFGPSVQCPHVPVHATGVQCPVRASERPGVQCPTSGVRACPRPLGPTEVRSWSATVGQAAARWDGRGRRGRLPSERLARRLPESEPGAWSWHRPRWPAEASAWT